MQRAAVFCLAYAIFAFSPQTAHTEPIPETILDHDYASCMGGVSAQHDPERGAYCACIRDRMRRWDLDTYGNVAMEETQSGGDSRAVPQKIQELAQECITKALK